MSKRLIWVSGAFLAVAIATGACWLRRPAPSSAGFVRLMNRGNGLLEKGDAAVAIGVYSQALRLSPGSTDVRLNLANAYLLADRPDDAALMCRQTLELDPNSAAAYYLLGCALLRRNQAEPAAEALQQSWKIDPGVPALDFQMGMAQEELGQIPDAIRDFESVIRAVPGHPSAHFQLSQLYRRAGRGGDAARELEEHQANRGALLQPGHHRGRAGTLQVHPAAVAVRPEPAGSARDPGALRGGDRRGVWRAGGRVPRSAGRHRL